MKPRISIYLLGLVGLLQGVSSLSAEPVASRGVIDLRATDLHAESARLKGEWAFYWKNFQPDSADARRTYISAPKSWNDVVVGNGTAGGAGFATYRLKVLLPDHVPLLMVYMKEQGTSAQLLINGKEIGGRGIVGNSPETSRPDTVPFSAIFHSDASELTIDLKVSNFSYRKGGMWNPLYIGTPESIGRRIDEARSIEIFLGGILFIMVVYHLGLFSYYHSEKSSLIFAGFCFSLLIRLLTTGQRLWVDIFPDTGFQIYSRLEFLSWFFSVPLGLHCVVSILPGVVPKNFLRLTYLLAIVYSLTLLGPSSLYSHTVVPSQIIYFVCFSFALISLMRYKADRPGALLFLASALVLFVFTLNDILYTLEIVRIREIGPFGIMFFILCQALFVSRRFFRIFAEKEELQEKANLELEKQVIERTKDLSLARDRAEKATEAQKTFLATVSHEIRTPMNGIIVMTELLLESNLSSEQLESIKIIKQSGTGLMALINDILDYSKIAAQKMEIASHDIDIRGVLSNAVDLFRTQASRKGLLIDLIVEPDFPNFIKGDALRYQQVFSNLLANAVKFTDRGKIVFHCSPVMSPSERKMLHFEITDTGIGIPEDRMGDLFQKFVQLDSSSSRKYGGTGLGLAIVAEIVNLMGGTVRAESKEGEGTRFIVETPLINADDTSTKINVPEKDILGHGEFSAKKVLIADDDPVNRLMLTRIFAQAGIHCVQATNGKEAMDAFDRDFYDLVFMDLEMPEMDGLTSTKLINAKATAAGKPRIVACTANVLITDRQYYRDLGFYDFVSKPFTPNQIRLLVRRAFLEI
ncbi:MAG: response regulator [Spirochaetia bacterium]|nr:response regulator [Spirochaetia bacterium]